MMNYHFTAVRKGSVWLKILLLALICVSVSLAVSAQSTQVSQISLPAIGYNIAVSPDSKMMVAAVNGDFYNNGVTPQTLPIALIDLSSGSPIGQLAGGTDFASGLSFSPDGKTLATYHNNGELALWDVASKSLKSQLLVGTPGKRQIRFLPDSEQIAVAEPLYVPTISLWDTESGAMVRLLTPHFDSYAQYSAMAASGVPDDIVTAFDVSSDGKSLVAATAKANVWLWNLANGDGQMIVNSSDTMPYLGIRAIRFSRDGSQIAFYNQHEKKLHLWNVASSSEATPIALDADAAVVSPDGKTVVWAKMDSSSISVAPIATISSATSVPLPNAVPQALSLIFTPDGKAVIVNGASSTNGQGQAVIDVVHLSSAS